MKHTCYCSVDDIRSDDIDDAELARSSEIFEREYYGYIADTELVEAMDRFLNIFNAINTNQTDDSSQSSTQIPQPSNSSNNIHTQHS